MRNISIDINITSTCVFLLYLQMDVKQEPRIFADAETFNQFTDLLTHSSGPLCVIILGFFGVLVAMLLMIDFDY